MGHVSLKDMMYHMTPIPNYVLDQVLPYVNQAELKVLLVILRQTIGWIDPKTKERKRKDWISLSFFARRTGLTYKSISSAIHSLVKKELILVLDHAERELKRPEDRRGKKRIYYAYKPYFMERKKKTLVDIITDFVTFPPYTKETQTKREIRRQTDQERIEEILRNKKRL